MSQKPPADPGADGASGGAERVPVPMDQGTAVLTPPPGPAPRPGQIDPTLPMSRTPVLGPAPMASSAPAQIGRYQIIERVGQGGMGVLYRGIDPVLDREVAIKLMIGDFADDIDQLRPRFHREARAIAKLQHRNIVTVFEFAEDGGTPYIVMEFLRGSSLAARVKAEPPLTLDEKIDVVTQLCAGLGYAHEQGIVHRDVKPANIFLLADGSVKLLDFGIAKLTTSTLTRQGDVLGSPSYMSPEQIMGLDSVDGRSDVFSAGAVLFEMIAGRRPFDGDTTPTIVMKILNTDAPSLDALDASIPAPLAAVVARALHKDPSKRFQTAAEFARELQAARRPSPTDRTIVLTGPIGPDTLAGRASERVPQAEPIAATPPSSRRWMVAAGIGGGVLVAAIVVATGVGRVGSRSTDGTPVSAASVTKPQDAAAATPAPATTPAANATTPAAAADKAEAPASGKVPAAVTASRETTAAAPAQLRITSEPVGAAISVDGRDTGQLTPASIALKGTGSHRVRLSKRGFQSVERRVTASAGDVSVTLTAAEASAPAVPAGPQVELTATGAYPFAIFDGGKQLSAASPSHTINVAAGKKLRLVAPQYSLNHTVTVEDGGGRSSTIQAPALGRLTIRSNQETCSVRIGDRDLGYPPVNNISIAAGPYQVDIVCPNGRNKSEFVNVIGGRDNRVIVP